MSIRIGGIDLTESLINAEFRIGVLEAVIDQLLLVAPPGTMTAEKMAKIRETALKDIQRRYPEAGIRANGEK